MNTSSILDLAREVEKTAFEAFDTYRDNHVGADLAYLLGAIFDNEPDAIFVDWSPEISTGILRDFMVASFGPEHPVWQFIRGCESASLPEGTMVSVDGNEPVAWRKFVIQNTDILPDIPGVVVEFRRTSAPVTVGGGSAAVQTITITEPDTAVSSH